MITRFEFHVNDIHQGKGDKPCHYNDNYVRDLNMVLFPPHVGESI
jgi:hypothetical protein